MSKNKKMVEAIVEDMKKYASGDYFIWNGELFPIDENEFSKVDGCTIHKKVSVMKSTCFISCQTVQCFLKVMLKSLLLATTSTIFTILIMLSIVTKNRRV